MSRIWALVERELRRFRRNPLLIVVTVVAPLVQLVVMGYAFGGTLHDLRVAVVDQDHGVQALRIRELAGAVTANARTFEALPYADEGAALADLRRGRVNAVLTIPPGFSRRMLTRSGPRLALVENNTDRFVSTVLGSALGELAAAHGGGEAARSGGGEVRLDVVELYPFVPYIQYLLPGVIVLSIYTMVLIGGAFSYIDDKTRGLHEGYLVTPISKLEMVAGFNLSGALKAIASGLILTVLGALIAGIPHPLAPLRLLQLGAVVTVTALALVSSMFLFLARVDDPMLPRVASQILNTLLYFPSGAVYPTQAFPAWMRAIAAVDPFTYAVHAMRGLLLQDMPLSAVAGDLAVLAAFSAVAMLLTAWLVRRSL